MEFIKCHFELPPHKRIDVEIGPNRGSTDNKSVCSMRELNRIFHNVRNVMKLELRGKQVPNSRGRERGIQTPIWRIS